MDALRAWARRGRRGRVPLRPRDHARAGARTASIRPRRCCRRSRRTRVLRGAEADRRAVGHRPGRLPARRLPGRLGRVERPLPRRRAPLLARRCRHAGRAGDAARRLGRPVRAAAAGRRAASTSSPRTTASRSPTWSPTRHKRNAANGEDNRDGTDANYSWNNGVEGPTDDPAIRAARGARPARAAGDAAAGARHADAVDGRRSSAARRAATTTPMRRTTPLAGSTGRRLDASGCALHRPADRAAARLTRRCAARPASPARAVDASGAAGRRLARRRTARR